MVSAPAAAPLLQCATRWQAALNGLHSWRPLTFLDLCAGACYAGQTGPRAHLPGYASVCEAYGGFRCAAAALACTPPSRGQGPCSCPAPAGVGPARMPLHPAVARTLARGASLPPPPPHARLAPHPPAATSTVLPTAPLCGPTSRWVTPWPACTPRLALSWRSCTARGWGPAPRARSAAVLSFGRRQGCMGVGRGQSSAAPLPC